MIREGANLSMHIVSRQRKEAWISQAAEAVEQTKEGVDMGLRGASMDGRVSMREKGE